MGLASTSRGTRSRVGPEEGHHRRLGARPRARNGLRFGVSVHAAHAWSWYETAQGADKNGPARRRALRRQAHARPTARAQWWEGLDPQDLYAQRHAPSPDFENRRDHGTLELGQRQQPPDQAYCEKFYNRTIDLIDKYQPDLLYFDDTALPLWPVSDVGLQIAAHFYNTQHRSGTAASSRRC